MKHSFTIGDKEHRVWLSRTEGGYRMLLDGRALPVSLESRPDGTSVVHVGTGRHEAVVAADGDVIHIHIDGEAFIVSHTDPIGRHAADPGAAAGNVVLAPMPGIVIATCVAPGDQVEAGQVLVVIESMKLETSIKACRDGRVALLHVAKGEVFERSAHLVTLAPPEPGGR